VCLRRHHLSKDCRSSTRCVHCGGRHHHSICKNNHGANKGEGDKQCSDSQKNTHLNPHLPALAESQPQLSSHSSGQQTPASTLRCQSYCKLCTKAYVHKPNQPKCGMTIKVMLDGESQRFCITQKVKDALGLQPENSE